MGDFGVDLVGLCCCHDYSAVMARLGSVEMDYFLTNVPCCHADVGFDVYCEDDAKVAAVIQLLITLTLIGLC